jgi:hypothetical protein
MRSGSPRSLRRRKAVQNSGVDAINNTYCEQSGSLRASNVGHKLEPLFVGGVYTTNLSTATNVDLGATLAIFNPTGSTGVVTFGDATVTLLAAGAVDSGGKGFVGIPLQPNSWTYLNSFEHNWVITTAGMLTYAINDDLYASNQN